MTTRETRKLGSQGPELTTIGFDSWAMGGAGWQFSWGPQNDEASIQAVHVALDQGINWFDTAAVYGLGHSDGQSHGGPAPRGLLSAHGL